MKWQPIETAPVDGTPFVGVKIFQNKLAAMAIVKKNPNLPDKMWQCCASAMIYAHGTVDGEETDKALGFLTHWMPLPSPPDIIGEQIIREEEEAEIRRELDFEDEFPHGLEGDLK